MVSKRCLCFRGSSAKWGPYTVSDLVNSGRVNKFDCLFAVRPFIIGWVMVFVVPDSDGVCFWI